MNCMGYCRNSLSLICGGRSSARAVQPRDLGDTGDASLMGPRNSATETLHLEQHKYPGDGSSRMMQGYGFFREGGPLVHKLFMGGWARRQQAQLKVEKKLFFILHII